MTLIVGGANADVAFLLADRRLTDRRGIVDEANTKLTLLECEDARVAVAYTGLARTPTGFDTAEWLLEALVTAGADDAAFRPMMNALARVADRDVRPFRSPLIIVAHGWSYGYAEYQLERADGAMEHHAGVVSGLRHAYVTNTDGKFLLSQFETVFKERVIPPGGSFVLVHGQHRAVDRNDTDALARMLRRGLPPQAYTGKTVELMRRAAGNPLASDTIGDAFLGAIMPARDGPVATRHFAPGILDRFEMPNAVWVGRGRTPAATRGVVVRTEMLPTVGRNARCPCGSTRRFKACHGSRLRRGRQTVTYTPTDPRPNFHAPTWDHPPTDPWPPAQG